MVEAFYCRSRIHGQYLVVTYSCKVGLGVLCTGSTNVCKSWTMEVSCKFWPRPLCTLPWLEHTKWRKKDSIRGNDFFWLGFVWLWKPAMHGDMQGVLTFSLFSECVTIHENTLQTWFEQFWEQVKHVFDNIYRSVSGLCWSMGSKMQFRNSKSWTKPAKSFIAHHGNIYMLGPLPYLQKRGHPTHWWIVTTHEPKSQYEHCHPWLQLHVRNSHFWLISSMMKKNCAALSVSHCCFNQYYHGLHHLLWVVIHIAFDMRISVTVAVTEASVHDHSDTYTTPDTVLTLMMMLFFNTALLKWQKGCKRMQNNSKLQLRK